MSETTEQGREATFTERATWGTCPVCEAGPGEWCHAEIGIQLGTPLRGGRLKVGDGAHLARLQNAPLRVRLVPCG